MLKRIVSMILCIVMLLTMLPVSAFAEELPEEEMVVPETTVVEETAAAETEVPETIQQPTLPEETTAPAETESQATEAAETVAETEATEAAEVSETEVPDETVPAETEVQLEASAEAANSYSGTSGSIRWVLDDDGCLTVSGSGAITSTPWSSYRGQIYKLVIGEGITEIGDYVFQYHSSIREISLPNTLTKLGYDAFSDCSSLVSVVLPDSVTYLDNDVFEDCTSLRTVVMGGGVAYLDSWMFFGCSSMEWIEFTGDAPEFVYNAFAGVTATVYYPGSNNTWTEDVRQNYDGDITWVPRYYEDPVSITLAAAPQRTNYGIGDEEIDLTGLKLRATDAEGNTWTISDPDDVTVSGFNTSRTGRKTVTVTYKGFAVRFDIFVHSNTSFNLQPSSGYPESSHDYSDNMDRSWDYTVSGAEYLELTFSANTQTESNYDYIYLYDVSGNELGKYDGTELAGKTVTVPGDTVTIRLTTDGSSTHYGFKLDSIYAMVVEHEYSGRGVYTAPTCFEDGYYTYNCSICGESYREIEEGTAGHKYVNGTCTECGMPENALDFGTSGSIQWVLDQNYCLTIMGSGEVPSGGPWSGYQSRIRELVIQDGITAIGDRAFEDYDGLVTVTIADSVRTLGEATFYECSSLESIHLPAYITSIPFDTFSECSRLHTVNIPDSVTAIGGYAFNDCYALTFVILPAALTEIHGSSFSYCSGLTSITFRGNAPSIDGSAFESVTANVYYPVGNSTWTADVRQNYGGTLTWISRSTPVALTLQSAPNQTMYQVGDTQINLAGLELLAEDAYGNTWVVTGREDVTVTAYNTSTTGRKTVTVAYEGLTAQFEIFVHSGVVETLQPSSGYPESSHEYGDSMDHSWDYSVPGAASLKLTFSSDTETESGCDYIYLYDGSGNEIGKYDGTELAGRTVTVPGNTVTIRLTTDGSVTRYGFSLTSIYAAIPVHEAAGRGVYTAPTCYVDGYYTHTCRICGCSFREWDEGTAGHRFVNGECTVCGMPENALDFGTSGGISWVLDEDYCLYLTGTGEIIESPWYEYQNRITKIVIGEGITAVGDCVFQGYSNVTELSLPNTVTRLGYDSFNSCTSLVSVTIPDSVTELCNDVFEECTSLTSVTMGTGVSYIGPWVFQACSSMERILFRGNAPTFESDAFYNVEATAYYPAANETWTEDVLQGYGGSINWVGRYEPVSVELLSAPNRIMYQLGDTKFDLTGLELLAKDDSGNTWVITEKDGVTVTDYNTSAVGWYPVTVAYEGFTVQFNIVIHESCERKLQPSVGYPESDHTYGDNVDVSWEYSVPDAAYLELTFSSNTETESGYDYIYLYDGSGNELGKYDGNSLAGQAITVSGDTVTIRLTTDGSETRYGFSLDRIYAFTVKHAHSGMYQYVEPSCDIDGYTAEVCGICGELFDKVIDEGSAGHRYEDGYCINCGLPENVVESGQYEKFTWMVDANNRLTIMGEGEIPDGCSPWADYKDVITEIVICDGINRMGYDLFWGYSNVRSVTIAESVTEISTSVFRECTSLTTINLPSGLSYIGDSTFCGCSSLESIIIPNGVEMIDFSAFENCSSLKSITIPASVTEIGDSVFAYCQNLTQIYFQGSAPYISGSAFTDVTAVVKYLADDDSWTEDVMQNYGGDLTWETFKANGVCGADLSWVLTDEGELIISGSGRMSDFDENSAPWSEYAEDITAVVLSEDITSIGDHAFYHCKNLTDFTIPDGVTRIGKYAFCGCSGLTEMTIPDGVTDIDTGAFGSTKLTSIVIPDSVSYLGFGVFSLCYDLKTVTVGTGVTYMGDWMFYMCRNLQQVIFQGNAPEFDDESFHKVETVLYYPSNNPTWTKSVRQSYDGEITWEAYTPAVEIIGEDGAVVSGSTLWIDLNAGARSVTFSAYTTPEMAHDAYYWQYNTDLATVAERDDGTVTVTARGIPGEMVLTAGMAGSSAKTSVTIKFVKLSVDSEEIEGEDPADMNLFAGKSKNLKVYDQSTGKALTAKQIKWSLDPVYSPYATINAKGKLTAKKVVEKVRIEAIGTIIGSENTVVTVTVDIFPAVTHVEILERGNVVNGKTIAMDVDETRRTFSVSAYPLDTAQEVTWSISDAKKTAYADYTIDGTTLIVTNPTGKAGTVTIKATVNVGVKKTASFKLNFGNFADKVEIINTEKTLTSGESLKLKAVVTPNNVTKTGVTWSLKNAADKAYVSLSAKGVLKAKTVYDKMPVTVVATSKDGREFATYEITIVPKNSDMLAIFNWLGGQNVTKGTFLVDLNEEYPEAHLVGGYLSEEFYTDVEWSYKQSDVAEIYEDGAQLVVAMKKPGSVKITAKAGGQTATTTVKAVRLTSAITIEGPENGLEVASGKAITLKATCKDGANKVIWSIVEGSKYAKISGKGKLTANKDITSAKEVLVRATAADGSGVYEEVAVTIRPIAQGVQIYSQQGGRMLFSVRTSDNWWVRSNSTLEWAMNECDTLQLSSRVYPSYEEGSRRNAIQGVTWKSSSNKIATVDENGLVTCHKPGTVTITATAKDGSGKKVSFKLKVINKIQSLSMEDQIVKGGKSLNLAKLIRINPTDATYKTFTWEITGGNGAAYASINAKGVLKAKKVKTSMEVEIKATAQDGSGESTAFTVTINP